MKGVCWLWVALALSACNANSAGDIRHWVQVQKTQVQPQLLPLAQTPVFEPLAYEGAQQIDPFNPLRLHQELTQRRLKHPSAVRRIPEDTQRSMEALENYPISAMEMVGMLRKEAGAAALIRVNHVLYTVKLGDRMGQNNGQVVHIEEARTVLREWLQNEAGDWYEHTTAIALQEGKQP